MEKLMQYVRTLGNISLEMEETFRVANIEINSNGGFVKVDMDKLDRLMQEREDIILKIRQECLRFDGDQFVENMVRELESRIENERIMHSALKQVMALFNN